MSSPFRGYHPRMRKKPKQPKKSKGKRTHLPVQIALRLSADLLSRVDGLVPVLEADPAMGPAGPWTRARAIRLLLDLGLAESETRFGKKGSGGS